MAVAWPDMNYGSVNDDVSHWLYSEVSAQPGGYLWDQSRTPPGRGARPGGGGLRDRTD
jgi:hypothetical protein